MTAIPDYERNPDEELTRAIERKTVTRLSYYVDHPEDIELRLRELDREWDIDRVLQAKASLLAFMGTYLGGRRDRRWLALPVLATGFLLQHAIQGHCPPGRILRRMGLRTRHEIEQERYALKALRGDFDRLQNLKNKISGILEIVGISAR
jgi:hypothetical protein